MEKINKYRKWKCYCISDQNSFSNVDLIFLKRKPRVVWCRHRYTRYNGENKEEQYIQQPIMQCNEVHTSRFNNIVFGISYCFPFNLAHAKQNQQKHQDILGPIIDYFA